MKNFLNYLYSNENFTTYLIIAIVVLIIIFLLVLFLGKKDKKLEETKRLEKINSNNNIESVPQESTSIALEQVQSVKPPESLQVTQPVEPLDINKTSWPINEESVNPFIATKINDSQIEPKTPVFEETKTGDNNVLEPIKFEINNDTPILKNEEEKPFTFDEAVKSQQEINDVMTPFTNAEIPEEKNVIPEPASIEISEIKYENVPEPLDNTSMDKIPEIEIPEFNFTDLKTNLDADYKKEEPKPEEKYYRNGYEGTLNSPKIFSSVYVNNPAISEEKNISEPVVNVELPSEIKLPNVEDEKSEDDFDLPQLKENKEPLVTDEIPTFNFDSINGESYKL